MERASASEVALDLQSDDFDLFDLPRRFAQDRSAIDARWKELQREAHPDRFAAQGGAAQRIAMQWSVRINEAYQRLKDPLKRAGYLCELRGAAIDAESNTAMPAVFLVEQLKWREELEEADGQEALDLLVGHIEHTRRQTLQRIEHLLDDAGDAPAAAQQVRALMFVERFARDVDRRYEQLGQ